MSSFNWPPQAGSGGSGTVTTVSVVSANGLAGSVANATTAPAITLSTTVTGVVKGNGTALSAAVVGTDYSVGTASLATGILKSTTATGALSIASASDLPLVYGNLTDVGTDGIVVTGGTGAVLGSGTSLAQHVADSTHNGYLSSTDWSTFNSKQSALTIGDLTDAGTDGIVVTGGTGSVIGAGVSLAQHVSDSTHNGYLSSTDWSTFNGKQAAGNYITALTGDGTAAGPGSAALTLATVNSNVGSFGSSTAIPSFTVNGKGLITAASTNVVVAPAGTLTGTTLAANVVTSSLTSVGTITSGVWNGTAVDISHGGTGQTSKAPAFDALSPMTTGGDIIYGGASGTGTRLANGSAGQVLTSNGTTLAPSWQTVTATGPISEVCVTVGNGNGSVNTFVRRWTNSTNGVNGAVNTGSDITYADSSTLGSTFTINTTGIYSISYCESAASSDQHGISINQILGTQAYSQISLAEQLGGAQGNGCVSTVAHLTSGDVIRSLWGNGTEGVTWGQMFRITRVG